MLPQSRLRVIMMVDCRVTKCAVLGASGHGKVVAEIAELNGYSEIHFYDDRWPELEQLEAWSVVGDSNSLIERLSDYDNIAVAIGHNNTRLSKYTQLLNLGAICSPLIHPATVVSSYSTVQSGTVVAAGVVINPYCQIGRACIINTSSTIDHDCKISDGVHISPGSHLAGGVEVGEESWVGIGSNIKQLVKIGSGSIVGAGAVVIESVADKQTVVGVPAKPIISKEIQEC